MYRAFPRSILPRSFPRKPFSHILARQTHGTVAAARDAPPWHDTKHTQPGLEKNSGDLFGDLICFFTALLLCHGRIVLGGGTNADDEGLVADAADDEVGVVVFFGVGGACDGFVAGGGEGRALGRALG